MLDKPDPKGAGFDYRGQKNGGTRLLPDTPIHLSCIKVNYFSRFLPTRLVLLPQELPLCLLKNHRP